MRAEISQFLKMGAVHPIWEWEVPDPEAAVKAQNDR